mgnify:CR=1 FL=1
MWKLNDLASGVKTHFLGFQAEPPAAKFSVERHQGDQRHLERWNVLIRHKPRTTHGYKITKSWAKRRLLEELEAAA